MRDAMRRRSSIDAVGRSVGPTDRWAVAIVVSFAERRRESVAMVTVTVPRTVPRTVRVRGRPSASRRARRARGGTKASGDDDDARVQVEVEAREREKKRRYVNFTGFPFPLVPLLSRRTTRTELVPGQVWAFEQEQGIGFGLGVSTNVRMTVIKLRDGSLWVHDPIAPTEECVELLKEIGGEVKHACLSTTQYEHKIFAPAFTRKFPKCELWIVPGQFSFPLPLPNAFLGLFPKGTLGDPSKPPPWSDEIETELLFLPPLFWHNYTYSEAAFYHKDTESILVTDAAVYVGETAPGIIPEDDLEDLGSDECFTIRLLKLGNYRGGRNITSPNIPANQRDERITNGWKRMALFSLFIAPDAKNILNPESSFRGLAGKFVVSPIVFNVVFQFYRKEVAEWAQKVSQWNAKRVIASHFPVPESATGEDFLAAFEFAKSPKAVPPEYVDAENDLASLNLVVRILQAINAVPKYE